MQLHLFLYFGMAFDSSLQIYVVLILIRDHLMASTDLLKNMSQCHMYLIAANCPSIYVMFQEGICHVFQSHLHPLIFSSY